MTTRALTAALGRVRGLLASRNGDDVTDGELLEAYVARRDAAAFTALLRRHGGLVLNVCRGVLHNEHDAEDAYQAAFLILARKAASIRRLASVGGWLYQVAHNVALKAKAARRRDTERPVSEVSASDPAAAMARQELCAALAEEMQRLPDKYRAPLVLCYLENLTTGEAARRLRWPVGTIKVRLMQGRDLLRKRLCRRGFDLPAVGVVSLLLLRSASTAAPAALVRQTVQAATLLGTGGLVGVHGGLSSAARLVEASLVAVRATRLKGMLIGLAVVALLAVGGGLMRQADSAEGADARGTVVHRSPDGPRETFLPSAVGDTVETEDDPLPIEASVRVRQDEPVVAVAMSPGGRLLAGAGTTGRIGVWDLPLGRRLPGVAPSGQRDVTAVKIRALSLGDDGRAVALVDDDRTSQLRDETTGAMLRRLRTEWAGPIPGPRDGLILSSEGELATVGGSWDGTVPIWEVRTGELRRTLVVSSGLVHNVVLSPDGKTLAAAARDESIRVLDVATGTTLYIIARPHGDAGITTVGFAPDGKTIVSGGTDGTICCWPLP